MGQENEANTEFPEKSSLIDFLYVDKERTDSLISQLRNGTLRSVTKTIGTSGVSSVSGKVNTGILNGTYGKNDKDEESAAEQYDPYHSQLINLLNDLNIVPLEKLPDKCSGNLVLLYAPVTIRDIASIKAILPTITKNQSMFGIARKETRNIFKIMNDMIQQMSNSISLSINYRDININGTLKESGLSIKQDDLMRTYGVKLPDKWFTLGILDSTDTFINDASQTKSIEDAIDMYASAMNKLYSQALYKIIPVLIFRIIKY